MEDEVSFGWSRSPSDSLEAAGFLAASLAVQQPLKQQLRKEGEEEPGSASGRSLQSSFRTGTSSSYLMQPSSRQDYSSQYDGNVVGGLYQEKRNPPLYGWAFIPPRCFPPLQSSFRQEGGGSFSPSSDEMKECPPLDTSWVGWTLQNDLHKILIPKHQSLFLTGKNPKNSWKNCQRAVGLILSTASG